MYTMVARVPKDRLHFVVHGVVFDELTSIIFTRCNIKKGLISVPFFMLRFQLPLQY